MKEVKRNVLLNPGPATTTDSVKYAQVVPDICPREKEFGDLMRFVSTELTRLVADPDRYDTVLFGGSGTAVVEAMLTSVVNEGKVLIIDNGAYGKRMGQIAEAYGLDYFMYSSSIYDPIDLHSLQSAVETEGPFTHLAAIHHETTTGLLNDLSLLGELCRQKNLVFLVDAMSSYAGIPMDLERDNISFMTASSNKNIQGMAGIGFVISKISELEVLKNTTIRSFYLNLYAQWDYFNKTGQLRFTPPVQTFYALKQAILETQKESVGERFKRYTKTWETLISGLEQLNLEYLVNKENQSHLITTVLEPENPGFSFEKLHDFCYEKGFTIYPGKVSDKNTFRLANIGEINSSDLDNFLAVLKLYLESINH
jgi:2-aminoethylphosphonate-pyruvate transaminase